MNLKPDCKVTGSLGLVLQLSRILGIAPVNFESISHGWRIHTSMFFSVYGHLLVLGLVGAALTSLISEISADEETQRTNSSAKRFVWTADIVIVGMVNIIAAFTGINRMRVMINGLAQMEYITQKLSPFNQSTYPNDKYNKLIIGFTLIVTVVTLSAEYTLFMFDVLNSNADEPKVTEVEELKKETRRCKGTKELRETYNRLTSMYLLFDVTRLSQPVYYILTIVLFSVVMSSLYIFYIICSANLMLYVMQFNQSVLWVLPCFLLLNTHLKKVLEIIGSDKEDYTSTMTNSNSITIKKNNRINVLTHRSHSRVIDTNAKSVNADDKFTATTLHQLGTYYCMLCDVTRMFNDSNGLILVILLMSILLHLIITPYHLIDGLFHSKSESGDYSTLLQVAWAIFHFSKLVMIVEPSHRTREQMELTKELVNQIRHYTSWEDTAVLSEVKLFYRHILLNYVSYAPLHLFSINRTLIAAILGSITTYLVIVIQF